jgi:hypothetical protein
MRPFICSLLVLAPVLAACTQAQAITPDPDNDIDCSVVAFYFSSEAQRSSAPEDHRRATAALHAWYAKRVQEVAAQRSLPEIEKRADPLLAELNRDSASMREVAASCTERAVREGLK